MKQDRPSVALDKLTATFRSDQRYCDALLSSPNSLLFSRILVYYKWARRYLPHIRQGLVKIAARRFSKQQAPNAEAWTVFLLGGILKDICLVPYLTARGVFSEAGIVTRPNLENLGVLAHFWSDPSKAEYLENSDSADFAFAFVRERDKKIAKELKQKEIRKRFAALHCFPRPASELYKSLSGSDVHGGTPLNVVLADENSISCDFIDRRDPGDDGTLSLLHAGTEILCAETAALHGRFGKRYGITPSMVGEGGRPLTSLLSPVDTPSLEMARELSALQMDLGVSITSDSRSH